MRAKQRSPFESLEVLRLGRSEWRIADAADPELVLGFIERQRSDRFEVVMMSDPMRWAYASSFEAALVAFGDRASFGGELLSQRVTPSVRSLRPSAADRRAVRSHRHRASWIDQSGESGII